MEPSVPDRCGLYIFKYIQIFWMSLKQLQLQKHTSEHKFTVDTALVQISKAYRLHGAVVPFLGDFSLNIYVFRKLSWFNLYDCQVLQKQ